MRLADNRTEKKDAVTSGLFLALSLVIVGWLLWKGKDFITLFMPGPKPNGMVNLDAVVQGLEARKSAGFIVWQTTSLLHVAISIGCIFGLCYILRRALRAYSGIQKLWALAVVFVAMIGSDSVRVRLTLSDIGYGVSIFDNSFAKDTQFLAKLGHGLSIQTLSNIIAWFESLSYATILFVAFAAFATMVTAPNKLDTANDLARQIRILQGVLNVGALILVANILELATTYNWALTFIPAPTGEPSTTPGLTSSLIFARGAFYSLFLASIYVPIAFLLKKRGEKFVREKNLFDEDVPIPAQEEESKRLGLTLSTNEQLARLIAILSPLLAGPAGEILKSIAK